MLTFHEFVLSSKKLLNNILFNDNYNNKILADFVIGAPTGDLDSIISSLLRGYYLSSTYYKLIRKEQHRHVFAIIPIMSSDFEINGVAFDLLRSVNISKENLIFLDDLFILKHKMVKVELGRVNLCNHSKLIPELEFLEPYVYSIIDCHDDVGSYDFIVHENLRIIDKNACCTCSLIAELFTVHEEMFFNQYYSNPLDPLESQKITSKLLFNTIVYQTQNLNDSIITRGQHHVDIQMVDYFAKKFKYNAENTLKQMQFVLKSYKFWHDLSVYDKMRCDYKRYNNAGKLGISKIPLPIHEFVSPIKNPNTGKLNPRIGYNQKEVIGYDGTQNVIDVLYDENLFINQAYDYMKLNDLEVYIIMTKVVKDPSSNEKNDILDAKKSIKSSSNKANKDFQRRQGNICNTGVNNYNYKKNDRRSGRKKAPLSKIQQQIRILEKNNVDNKNGDDDILAKQILIASIDERKFNGFLKILCNDTSNFDLTPLVEKELCLGTSDMGEEIISSTWGGQLVENFIEGKNEHVHFKRLYIKLFNQGNMVKEDTDVLKAWTKFLEHNELFGTRYIKFHKV